MSFFKKIFSKEKKETLDKGLEKSKENFFGKLSKAVAGKSKVDDEVLDDLEEVLVTSVEIEKSLLLSKSCMQRYHEWERERENENLNLDSCQTFPSLTHPLYHFSHLTKMRSLSRNQCGNRRV